MDIGWVKHKTNSMEHQRRIEYCTSKWVFKMDVLDTTLR